MVTSHQDDTNDSDRVRFRIMRCLVRRVILHCHSVSAAFDAVVNQYVRRNGLQLPIDQDSVIDDIARHVLVVLPELCVSRTGETVIGLHSTHRLVKRASRSLR